MIIVVLIPPVKFVEWCPNSALALLEVETYKWTKRARGVVPNVLVHVSPVPLNPTIVMSSL